MDWRGCECYKLEERMLVHLKVKGRLHRTIIEGGGNERTYFETTT